jgi:hypothetical protein
MKSPQPSLKSSFTALALVLGAMACNETPLHDVGDTSRDLSDSNEAPLPPVAEFANDFAGVWIGEALDPLALASNADDSPPSFRFPSGSTRIRLELRGGAVYPQGELTFGDAVPPPPATNPDIGYPVADPDFDINAYGAIYGRLNTPIEGFPHPVLGGAASPTDINVLGLTSEAAREEFFAEGRIADGRLDLAYATTAVFNSWCELQTSATCPQNEGFLVDNDGACFFGDQQTPIDCQKLALCSSNVCFCETSPELDYCTGQVENGSVLSVRLSDDGLVGLFSNAIFLNERGFQQPIGTVKFHREAP